MTDKRFPPEFKTILRHAGVKKAFISDLEPITDSVCSNCGGAGSMYLFVATKGPFESPPAAYSKGVTKSDIIGGRIRWWVGESFSYPCPVCGSGLVQEKLPEPEVESFPPPAHVTKELRSILQAPPSPSSSAESASTFGGASEPAPDPEE